MKWAEVFHQYKDGSDVISRASAQVILQDLGDLISNADSLASFSLDGFSSPMSLDQFIAFVQKHNMLIDTSLSPTFGKNLIDTVRQSKIPSHEKLSLSLAFSIEADIAISKACDYETECVSDDIPYV